MPQLFDDSTQTFSDRRSQTVPVMSPPHERRQFTDSYTDLTEDARELANAIDAYKLHHRRRFINYEEMLSVVRSLGYRK